ncbi:MAG: hypothetical protein R6V01_11195 [Thermoplasmatota archaeon]
MNIKPLTLRSVPLLMAAIFLLFSIPPITQEAGGAPAGTQESIWMTIDIDFRSITDYGIHADLEVYSMEMEDTVYNATEIRDLYLSEPDPTASGLEDELLSRTMNVSSSSLEGDELEVTATELDLSSMSRELSDNDPILFSVDISGRVDESRFLDGTSIENIDMSRMDHVVTGLLLSGFHISRTITLRSGAYNSITYRFPEKIDPLGDGDIEVVLTSSEYSATDGTYSIVVNGEEGELSKMFPFEMRGNDLSAPTSETITGEFTMDWYRLDEIDLGGNVMIYSIDLEAREVLSGLPGSMNAPAFIGAGTIGWAYREGLLGDDDISDIEEQVSEEVESGLSDTLVDRQLSIKTEAGFENLPAELPSTGDEMKGFLGSDGPIFVSVGLDEPAVLDVLEGYELQDIMDLLHGGLRIRREMSYINDDRFDLLLELPPDLRIEGEEPFSDREGRHTYTYSGGMKVIGSDRAFDYRTESINISSRIDLTDVSSNYISDLEMTLSSESTFHISVIEHDPDEMDFETDLDYELDHLSSDMLRLLMKMDIVDPSEISDIVREQVIDLLDGLVDEKELHISVVMDGNTTAFVSDGTMDGSMPIKVDIFARGSTDPLGSASSSMVAEYIPYHRDPTIPVKSIEKSIDIGTISKWDTDIEVHFPSGTGVRAWRGNSTDEKGYELPVDVKAGHPVLRIETDPRGGNVVLLELEIGPYFGFNHVSLCFFSTWALLLLFIIIIILIIRGMVKKKRKEKEEREDTEDEEKNGEPEEDGRPSGGPDEELSW